MKVRAINQGFHRTLREDGDIFDVEFGTAANTKKVVEASTWLEPVKVSRAKKEEAPAEEETTEETETQDSEE